MAEWKGFVQRIKTEKELLLNSDGKISEKFSYARQSVFVCFYFSTLLMIFVQKTIRR